MKKIFTVGSSNRTWDEFLNLLKMYRIQALVDARRFLTSKFDHFKQENLAGALEKAGINYIYLGQELGGYQSGGYEKYTSSERFKEGIEMLEKLAEKELVAVMCAEKLPWRCHRRFIGNNLQRRGWQVIHVIDEGREWTPKG
ncbi:MAG: DUF488 domain-containing protein [Actinomycetota bacterium]|nr:DUF488 domain-containing protein [Actinomycetota bacterium]